MNEMVLEAHSLVKTIMDTIKQDYSTNSIYLKIIEGVESLLDAGEYQIALEIVVSNICESQVKLLSNIVEMIVQAFTLYKNEKYIQISKLMEKEFKEQTYER